ncbi:LysR family transcriptional regulator [Phenylobacterium sp.]|uniref:LysR family transcriptional regulator n=1 Tax=Phenylobacterium sp. TaxID=1871053 RepID=UPI0025F398B2|nr:LysR family transcriptional regulator [Phenylobacterium sp.]
MVPTVAVDNQRGSNDSVSEQETIAMDRLDEIRAFTAVAEARSFTQGARKLDVSPAQISKLVARLENRLDARLLNRTTRDVSLTDTGQAYLERARELLEGFDALESSVRDQSGPSGQLKVSAPVSFGKGQLTPALLDFASAHPAVSLDVAFADRLVNLVEEGFDVAVRIGHLTDSSLVAKRLAAVRMVTCASPDYLARHGLPAALEDLARHEAVLDTNAREATTWTFGSHSDRREVRVHGRLRFNGAEACVAAAVAGFGVTRTPAFAAADDLRAGRIVPILCNFEPELIHVHAVYPHARHLAAKVRAFVDFLAQRYAGEPQWHQGWGAEVRRVGAL